RAPQRRSLTNTSPQHARARPPRDPDTRLSEDEPCAEHLAHTPTPAPTNLTHSVASTESLNIKTTPHRAHFPPRPLASTPQEPAQVLNDHINRHPIIASFWD